MWRTVTRTDRPDHPAPVVVTGPGGGYVHDADLVTTAATLGQGHGDSARWLVRWDLDPFRFLETALGLEQTPRPDVTTENGVRVAFSHIDGDGIANLTQDLPGKPVPAGRVILEEILKKHPVPVTVGLVAGRIDPEALGSPAYIQLGREIHALPHVQASCHGYAHPLVWAGGMTSLTWPGHTFSAEQETTGAIDWLKANVLGDRTVDLYLWTGDCTPTEAQIDLLAARGILNMNGGDPRLDAAFPSVTNLCPLTRPVGRHLQVHVGQRPGATRVLHADSVQPDHPPSP